jgi:hypothetical protein
MPAMGYRSMAEAEKDIGLYLMDYYNWQRPHTAKAGGLSQSRKKNLIYCPELFDHYICAPKRIRVSLHAWYIAIATSRTWPACSTIYHARHP